MYIDNISMLQDTPDILHAGHYTIHGKTVSSKLTAEQMGKVPVFLSEDIKDIKDIKDVADRKEKKEIYLDRIRGSLFGGAVGDALGYPVEFMDETSIFRKYGPSGIREYELDTASGKALVSDDTQMTLFTADGILVGETWNSMRGIGGNPSFYIAESYQDWLYTQNEEWVPGRNSSEDCSSRGISWLLDVPELYSRRAPGNTCLSALRKQERVGNIQSIENPKNESKGCGGIMRVAPLALHYRMDMKTLDKEGAEIAAITHGHSLGYMPAAIVTHIISRIIYGYQNNERKNLEEIILEAKNTAEQIFAGDENLHILTDMIDRAIFLSHNRETDLDNIHRLGEGWVAEETLGIALYCSLKYQNDFTRAVVTAVNHKGDSDSTGAVTGNIVGAVIGYGAMENQWKHNLELSDVILEMADDLCHGCLMSEYSHYEDKDWVSKYINMSRPSGHEHK